MVEQAGLAEFRDVPLSGFLCYAERSGGMKIGCTVEGIRKGVEKRLAFVVGCTLATRLVEVAARQGLKDCGRVLQQDFDHRQGGGKVGISTFKDGFRLFDGGR